MTLKERIRELANSQGLSLPNLEVKLGLGNGTIVKWDKSVPNTDKLTKVADYFGVSIDYLLGRTPEIETTIQFNSNEELVDYMEIVGLIETLNSNGIKEIKRYLAYISLQNEYLNNQNSKMILDAANSIKNSSKEDKIDSDNLIDNDENLK